MAKPFGLPKDMLLRSKKDIDAVFRRGRYHALGVLHAKTVPNETDEVRFLISVRKAIGSAPRRNRIKRLVREVIRLHRHELETPHDICFFLTARPPLRVDYTAIESEILKLFARLSRQESGGKSIK